MTLKESILEDFWIMKTCLTTSWFWIPIVFAVYVPFQLWMFIFIHPLSVFVVPSMLCIFAVREEDRRVKAQYADPRTKLLRPTHLLGTGPEVIAEYEVEKRVKEYMQLIKKREDEEH